MSAIACVAIAFACGLGSCGCMSERQTGAAVFLFILGAVAFGCSVYLLASE